MRVNSALSSALTLHQSSDTEVIAALVELQDLALLDVGCGDGALARALAQRGAKLLAIEPNVLAIRKNRSTAATSGVEFVAASGVQLPLVESVVDGVLFVRSLHHVPVALMDSALREARRVLRPNGFLMVIEPEIESPFSRLMKPFHDESTVRTAAREALARLVPEVFSRVKEYDYRTARCFADFDDFCHQMTAASFRKVARAQVQAPEVRAAFERGKTENGYVFDQRMRVNLFDR